MQIGTNKCAQHFSTKLCFMHRVHRIQKMCTECTMCILFNCWMHICNTFSLWYLSVHNIFTFCGIYTCLLRNRIRRQSWHTPHPVTRWCPSAQSFWTAGRHGHTIHCPKTNQNPWSDASRWYCRMAWAGWRRHNPSSSRHEWFWKACSTQIAPPRSQHGLCSE